MRRIALAAVAAAFGVAALPAAWAQAMPPGPRPICIFTQSGLICTTDILPLADQIVADPVGYVCGNPNISCGFTREG